MKRIGEHAVVIGASMAGLLAARVLAEAYERVTVVDRDELPTGPVPRQAVPQGRHAHTLLPLGQQQLEELLPGFPAELTAAGAPSYYLRRLRAVAATDPVVAGAFIAVVGMRERPPHVLRPAVAARVVRGPRPVEWSDRAERVRRRELCVGAVSTPLREAGPADAPEAVVLVHGNPGSSADWEPLLAALGARRRAVAWDAPGFGAASAPHGFTHTVDAHAAFVGRALDALGIERAHLVLHDFGGPWGLRWAAEQPDRFASAVLLGTGVTPGYRWHTLARIWRTTLLGEAFMAATNPPGFRLLLRRGQPRPLPRSFVDRMYHDFDRHTRRAVLRLYRSIPDVSAAGERLADALRPLDRPALVIWGRHDPYLPASLAERQREAFPHADIRVLDEAGHWPFVDAHDSVTAAIERFLEPQAETGASVSAGRPTAVARP